MFQREDIQGSRRSIRSNFSRSNFTFQEEGAPRPGPGRNLATHLKNTSKTDESLDRVRRPLYRADRQSCQLGRCVSQDSNCFRRGDRISGDYDHFFVRCAMFGALRRRESDTNSCLHLLADRQIRAKGRAQRLDSVSKFFAMGGYALYVWSAVGLTVAVMAALAWQSWRSLRRAERAVSDLEQK